MPLKPNVIIVTTDQQRPDSLSCYGSGFTATPNIDRLAAEGVLFERGYCTNPVCAPSRASLFTGKNVSRHGVWNVGISLPTDEVLISHRLHDRGYRTHYVGKAHFQTWQNERSVEFLRPENPHYPGFRGPYYGFDTVELSIGHTTFGFGGHFGAWVRSQLSDAEFKALNAAQMRSALRFGGEAYDWALPLKFHSSVWTADRALHFMEQHDGSQPFLLGINFQDPHHPHCVPQEFQDRVDPAAVPLPDFDPAELELLPPHFQEAYAGTLQRSAFRGQFSVAGYIEADYRKLEPADARLGRAYYYSLVKLIDQQLGRVLRRLDELGLADNTLLIFTSDHGEMLGDHGLWCKGPFHFEQALRVPLLMRWPGQFGGGRRIASLASLVDIAPTIAAAAGLEPAADYDGVNLLPLARGETAEARDHVLVEHVDDPDKLRLKTIVTPGRKLTWYAGRDFGELFDLERDPREKRNLWNDPTYAAEKARLLGLLLGKMERTERRLVRECYV